MRGRIAALIAAVRVRARSPYIVDTSLPQVAARPRERASSTNGGEVHARGERDRREAHRRTREAAAEAHDAHARHVAFEQRVRRLRGGVRDERDVVRVDRVLAQQALQSRDDPSGDAVGMIVRGRHLHRRDERARLRIDGDDVGERSPDVDADAYFTCRRAPPA
jgi:hypothetical protein